MLKPSPRPGSLPDGIPAVDKAQERCIRSNCLRIDCLKLCGRRRFDVSVRVHIVQLTAAERVVRHHLLYLGRQGIAPSLIVEKEKQFVFEDRPADAAPNWLRFSGGRSTPFLLLKKSFAAKMVLRLYSCAEPCQSFVPLLVTRLICPPLLRPKPACPPPTMVCTSSIESMGAEPTAVNACPMVSSFTSSPSSVIFP